MTRVRIGVVGCGAIAQIQHLPFLSELAEEFEIAAVCDVSPSAAKYAAELFHVPNRYTDYRDLLASDVDAVLLCQTDPKTEVATLDAGNTCSSRSPCVCLLTTLIRSSPLRKRRASWHRPGTSSCTSPR